MARRSSNFEDPVGLVLRMLASGHRAAYGALSREAMRILAAPVDWCLSHAETRHLRDHSGGDGHPVVLIVGAPRSGTTLVYQVLSHSLDVTFPTNATSIFRRSPITTTLWQQRRRRVERPDFSSYYGQTRRLSDCNDGFDIWDRWLGTNRYRPEQNVSTTAEEEMRAFFAAWTQLHGRPFLNKNNRNALAISLLSKAIPNAGFVVVRRNPVMVAQSLIVARQKVQGSKHRGWGLESAASRQDGDPLGYVDAVCRQIQTIDSAMNCQLATVDPDRIVETTYEGFCAHPQSVLRRIVDRFAGVQHDPNFNTEKMSPLSVSAGLTISEPEQDRIMQCLRPAAEPTVI